MTVQEPEGSIVWRGKEAAAAEDRLVESSGNFVHRRVPKKGQQIFC
jgi:hypothetical protein